MKTKFIFVTGGVVSSLGKGISAASIGYLLKSRGFKVYMQKFDPYINTDASKLSPLQHGEVFITEDGAQTDLDLGHYERFIDVNLTSLASVSSGKIYTQVLEDEKNDKFDGRTIQVIPHITDEIKRRILNAANSSKADFVITEIGGTVGDIESLPMLEAIRQFRRDIGFNNALFLHATLVPYLRASKEVKTKPTQHSVKELRSIGIIPDMLLLRSEIKLNRQLKKKVAEFCDIKDEHVFDMVDVKNIFQVIPMLFEQKIDEYILKHFKLETKQAPNIKPWINLIDKIEKIDKTISISLVGPYVSLHDAYLSISEALKHAGYSEKTLIKINWINSSKIKEEQLYEILSQSDGVIIPGGYFNKVPEIEIKALSYAKKNNIPTLGICLGMELMVLEAFQNEAGLKKATSEEFFKNAKENVYIKNKDGKTVLGAKDIYINKNTNLERIYKKNEISERFRYDYSFNYNFIDTIKKTKLLVSALIKDPKNIVAVERAENDFYIGVQFHPEYKSRPLRPHMLFIEFVKFCIKHNLKNSKNDIINEREEV